jgi:hypothetical protein
VALYGAPIEDDRRGLDVPLREFAPHHPQVVGHRLKTSRPNPAQGLLMHRRPRRQIMRQQAPRTTGPHHPAQGIKDRPQRVLALRRLLVHQGQIGHAKLPFLVAHIGRIAVRFAGRFLGHPKLAAPWYSQSTDLSAEKVHDTL